MRDITHIKAPSLTWTIPNTPPERGPMSSNNLQ